MRGRGGEIPMYHVSRPYTIGSWPKGEKRRSGIGDEDSEMEILQAGVAARGVVERKGEIVKTVVHTVRSEESDFVVKVPRPMYRNNCV